MSDVVRLGVGPLTQVVASTAAGAPACRLANPALERRCEVLYPRLVGAMSLYTGSVTEAEDLAQETLCRLVERWDDVRVMDAADGWVFTVAFNLARSRWRRTKTAARAMLRLRAETPISVVDPETETAAVVRDAVAALPPRQREVIALRYFLERSVAETAVLMGCAEGTVKSLTSKATARLAVDLDGSLEDGAHR